MRSLIISIIILSVCVIGVCTNAFLIKTKTDRLIGDIGSLYNKNEENYNDLLSDIIKQWEGTEALLAFTVNRDRLGAVEHLLTELTVALAENDKYEIIYVCSSLIDTITEIRAAQIFDLKTIL